MRDYDSEPADTTEDPDPRVVLVQQIVDMEQTRDRLNIGAKQLWEKVAALDDQLRNAREELRARMGWDAKTEADGPVMGELDWRRR